MNGLKPDPQKVALNFVIYARCSGHFVPGGIDNLYALYVMPGHRKYQEPCSVYYFQTLSKTIFKFGISNNVERRSKSKERGGVVYINKMSQFDLTTRSEAICIEECLKENIAQPPEFSLTPEESKEFEPALGQQNTFPGCEFSRLPVNEFNSLVDSLRSDYQELGSKGFINKHFPDVPKKMDEDVSKILSGEYRFTQTRRDDWEELDENDECRKPGGNIYYKNHDSWQSGFHKVEVPIEQIPDQFRTAYKFKLIPDSAWH